VAGSGPFSREETPDSEHVVQFYESDAFLAEVVSRFVVEGLAAGEAVVVIATGAHRRDVEQRLRARGVDPAAAGREDRYVALDGPETLARFMIDARPDPVRFDEVLSAPILRASAGGGRRVRAFGEMVALLGAQGNFEGAIRLEALWNELSCRLPFSLLCAYPIATFGSSDVAGFLGVCRQHVRVVPAESFTALGRDADRSRAVALLQQKAIALGWRDSRPSRGSKRPSSRRRSSPRSWLRRRTRSSARRSTASSRAGTRAPSGCSATRPKR